MPRMGGLRVFRAAGLLGLGALTFSSCWSWRSTRIEFDSVAGYEEERAEEPEELEWRSMARRYPWIYRQFETSLVTMFADATGVERGWTEVKNPARFASDRILWLAELAGEDLLRMGETSWRLLLVLDRDPAPLHRIYAAQGLGLLLKTFAKRDRTLEGLRVIGPAHLGLQEGDSSAYRLAARELVAGIEGAWVGRRKDAMLGGGGREDFAKAVDELAKLTAGDLEQERLRLRLLLEAVRYEPYRPLQERLAGSLVFALQTAAVHGLRRALLDRDGGVRVAALETLSELGGPPLLPRLLELLESRPEALADASFRCDPDPGVRRALVHSFWGGDAALAEERYAKGRSGFEFLHEVAGSDPEPSMRILAADALAWLVGREADPFGEWIPEWWQGHLERMRGQEEQGR